MRFFLFHTLSKYEKIISFFLEGSKIIFFLEKSQIFFKEILQNFHKSATMKKIIKIMQEIERQFVVNTDHPDWKRIRDNLPAEKIMQATIHRGNGNKLRVRLIENLQNKQMSGSFAFKVVQKSGKNEPNIREEYEWSVPPHVAHYIMIGHPEVVKIRRKYLHHDGKMWDIDEYQGLNEGVVLADLELKSLDEKFKLPAFLGQESTKLKKITNNSFSLHPYAHWTKEDHAWYETLKKPKKS